MVLDASALLAMLNDEPGAGRVADAIMLGSMISAVNISEVAAKLSDYGMPAAEIRELLTRLDLRVIPFDEALAYEAGFLRRETRGAGLSFGDRACLALAVSRRATVLTADRQWTELITGLTVEQIR
jgi:PIN domain nuclease of toxin-antitoxin system